MRRRPCHPPSKRTLVQPDLRPFFFCKYHAHHIEPARRNLLQPQLANIASCHRPDMTSLGCVHRHFRRHKACPRMGLYLDETQHPVVPSDHVDFAVVPRRTKIPRDNAIAQAAEIEVRFHLAATGSSEVRRQLIPKVLRSCPQRARDKSSEPRHGLANDDSCAPQNLVLPPVECGDFNHTSAVGGHVPRVPRVLPTGKV